MWPEDARPGPDSPPVLEEDEAEMELQKQLEKGRKLRQIQQLKDSGEKVRACKEGQRPGPRWGRRWCLCNLKWGRMERLSPPTGPQPLSQHFNLTQGLVGPVG